MNIFAVYKGERQIFASGHIDPLVINIVLGLNDIGTNFLDDSFVFMELEHYSINVQITLTGTVFIILNKNKERINLEPFIKSYSKSCIYGDENLLNVLIFDNY